LWHHPSPICQLFRSPVTRRVLESILLSFVFVCFVFPLQHSHSDLIVSVSFHRLHQYLASRSLCSSYWNMKFIALSIAFSSANEIGTSFSILYLPSNPVHSYASLFAHYRTVGVHHQLGFLFALSMPSKLVSITRCCAVFS
jgi:hypothetical protein